MPIKRENIKRRVATFPIFMKIIRDIGQFSSRSDNTE